MAVFRPQSQCNKITKTVNGRKRGRNEKQGKMGRGEGGKEGRGEDGEMGRGEEGKMGRGEEGKMGIGHEPDPEILATGTIRGE